MTDEERRDEVQADPPWRDPQRHEAQQEEWTDERLEQEGRGFTVGEPEVAAAQYGTSASLVRAAFALRGHRRRLHEDEMQAALEELNGREV